MDDFDYQFTLTVPAGFVGTYTGFPVPVRISPTLVSGFDYADVKQSGQDVIFMSELGTVYPSECEIWDPSGESLFWVRLPSVQAGDKFVCRYGTDLEVVSVAGMWNDYAGVWHMDETTAGATVVADAAGVSPGTSHANSTIVDGKFGKARKLNLTGKEGGLVVVPKNATIDALVPNFTVSGWVNLNTLNTAWGYLFSKKTADSYASWGLQFRGSSGATDMVGIYSNGTSDKSGQYAYLTTSEWTANVWQKYDVVYTSTTVSLYINGALVATQAVTPGAAVSGDNDFAIGGFPTKTNTGTLPAAQDEVRLRSSAVSADWIANEYALQSGTMAFTIGNVEPVDPTAIRFESAPTSVKSANGFTVSAKVIAGAGALSVIYGTAYPFANTNQVEASVVAGTTYQYEITALAADASYSFGVIGVSTGGNVTENLGTQVLITGDITVVKGADADETTLSTPGYFTVSRPLTATIGDVVVNYELSGTAVAGTHYVALPGSVTIPDGESSVRVDVYPLAAYHGDHTLTLTVTNGLYNIGASGSASLTIKSFSASSGFTKKIVFTPSGYAGSETLTDFPMLVRLSTAIEGFNYANFELPNGGDIRFATEDGAPLAHEIDTWNTEGESLVWVKVPSFTKDTKIIAYYGNPDPWSVTTADVWNGYVGVWHMNGGSGTETDVTGHGLTATPTGSKLAEMIADDDAPIGAGRVNQSSAGKYNRLSVPNYNDYITNQSVFTLSGWFKMKTASGYPRPLSRKTKYDEGTGWEIQYNNNSKTQFEMRGSSSTQVTVTGPDATAGWEYLTFVFDETTGTIYANGVQKNSGTITAVKSRTDAMAIGNNSNGSEQGWCGSYDEVRLYNGILTADRIAADYETVTNATFVTCEEVEPVDASAVKFEGKPTVVKTGSTFKVGVSTASDSGDGSITAVYTADGETQLSDLMTSTVVPSSDYEVTLTHLAADTSYRVGVRGENAKGTITKANADNALYNGVPAVVKTRDADEAAMATPGLFTISRADSYGDLVVNYTTGGDAVAGTDYVEISGTVTIPDGQTSATIAVTPIRTKTVDHTLTITLTDGLYLLGSPAPTASMTIKTLTTPTGYNTWIAEANGNASVAANWSEGRVPLNTDNILIDARYSNASMTWDAGENGLPATVASWTQSYSEGDAEYSGTVTFKTVYPGKGEFTCFTVTGACVINCGTWTHPQSRTMGDKHDSSWDWLADLKANETYRIRLACGSLSVGAKGSIDVKTKGYYASHDSARCYAAHGGTTRSAAKTYDDPKEPIHIGLPHRTAGGYYNGKGGGAIYITVTDDAVVNGAICADSGNTGCGAGAAGSVYLKAHAVTGTGSITAKGSATGEGNYKGTGGRIAIITETTVNRGTFAAISAEAEWKNAQNGQATEYGGCGTVYFKDSTMTNGKLVIAPKSDFPLNWTNRNRMPVVGTDGDWTFDSIEFGRNGLLVLPVGTALHLPGGLASGSGTESSSSLIGGIWYEGGTLDLGSAANQTMSGYWMLFANSNLTINANVTVTGGAVIGVPEYGDIIEEGATLPAFPACRVTVNGNLTVNDTGKIKAEKCGFRKNSNNTEKGLTTYDCHGGRTLAFGKTLKLHYQGYDSVFNPCLPGCTVPQTNGQGAGYTASVLDILVTGTLTANGPISATAIYQGAATHNSGAGPGGSVKITAGALVGSGSISADGACNSGNACGGGGRIAVRLTNPGATFAGFSGSIIASGRLSSADKLYNSSSAGTVYLQTAAEKEMHGTIRIANRMVDKYYHANNTNTTEMASLGYGGDDVEDYKGASYVVADYGRAAVNTKMSVKGVTLADTTAYLDLEGNELTVTKFVYKTSDSIAKLPAGTYTCGTPGAGESAFPAACANVYDSVTGGKLIVKPNGMKLVLR